MGSRVGSREHLVFLLPGSGAISLLGTLGARVNILLAKIRDLERAWEAGLEVAKAFYRTLTRRWKLLPETRAGMRILILYLKKKRSLNCRWNMPFFSLFLPLLLYLFCSFSKYTMLSKSCMPLDALGH